MILSFYIFPIIALIKFLQSYYVISVAASSPTLTSLHSFFPLSSLGTIVIIVNNSKYLLSTCYV